MSNVFQYCPKFVIFNTEFDKVLLCKRKWEADYNETWSCPGGKVENSDNDVRVGMRREKTEELWSDCIIKLYQNVSFIEYFIKENGVHMILPHYCCVYEGGDIHINEEYSEWKWFDLWELMNSDYILISTIQPIVKKILGKCEMLQWSDSFTL